MNIDKLIKDAVTYDDNNREVPYGTFDRSWKQIQERKSIKNNWFKEINFSMLRLSFKEVTAITTFILILILVPSLTSHYKNVKLKTQPANPIQNNPVNNQTIKPIPKPPKTSLKNAASYNGHWATEKSIETERRLLDLKIRMDGSVEGTYSFYDMASSRTNAWVDLFFKGTITSEEQTYKLEDSRGHLGDITLKFQGNKIYATIEIPNRGIGTLQKSTYTFVRSQVSSKKPIN